MKLRDRALFPARLPAYLSCRSTYHIAMLYTFNSFRMVLVVEEKGRALGVAKHVSIYDLAFRFLHLTMSSFC